MYDDPCSDRSAALIFLPLTVPPELPEDLRAAIADGWQGLTLLADAPDAEPVTLLCAACEGRLRALGRCALNVACAAGGAGEPQSRLLVMAMETDADAAEPRLSVGIDLGYAEARALLARVCEERALRIVWVPVDGDSGARVEMASLDPEVCGRLRATVAQAAEWHVDPPPPLGVDPAEWARARRRPPRLIEASFAEGPVAVAIPAALLAGLDGRSGRVGFLSPLLSPHGPGRPGDDLRLRFAWEGEPAVERTVSLSLAEGGQRELARRLAGQRQMLAIGVTPARPGPTAHVRVSLGTVARQVIVRAARAARARDGGGGG